MTTNQWLGVLLLIAVIGAPLLFAVEKNAPDVFDFVLMVFLSIAYISILIVGIGVFSGIINTG